MTKEVVRRKKDIVSMAAVFLFAAMILFEVYIIYLIPSLLREEGIWKRDIAVEELIELQDDLRSRYTWAMDNIKSISDEVELGKSCLDSYARYLRENKGKINLRQAKKMFSGLLEFQRLHKKFWSENPIGLASDRKLDTSNFIKLQEERLK